MTISIFDKVLEQLDSLEFKSIHHKETYTSEESARVRGESISIGGKAIIMKIDDNFLMFVLSAALQIDSKKIKKKFSAKKVRFATRQELLDITGLVPGSIPPFGALFGIDMYLDESVVKNSKIAFNAGSLTDSIIMDVDLYLKVSEHKEIFLFSKSA